jgi:cyclic-di-GMP phosphodiesterase TipF (flagellum assembly factor)
MIRLAAIFVAFCMVLIAGSVAAVLYLYVGLSGAEAAMIGLATLTGLALYNAVTTRLRDRSDIGEQIADLSRLTADLARQLAEIKLQLATAEGKVDGAVNRARATVDPLASEMNELANLVKQLAETVAAHATALESRAAPEAAAAPAPDPGEAVSPVTPIVVPESGRVIAGSFGGQDKNAAIEIIREAVEANRVELYLQPIVTLPQRKVRYYEATTRLRTAAGEQVLAGDFLPHAENGGLMPRIDNLLLLRCVQVLRRLLMKNRDVGLFCNVSATTLSDPEFFPQFSDFMDANRVLAPSLVFEFRQNAFRAMGPKEFESLAALKARGFRFSMDHISDLRMEPRELSERGFRFIKASAALLLNRNGQGSADIDTADLSDLLARFNIDLVAERIESESSVVNLLDFDVRFGQGFLFSQPRPVRADAFLAGGGRGEIAPDLRAEPRFAQA